MSLGDGAHDEAGVLGLELLGDVAQTLTLALLKAAGDPDAAAAGHVHQVAPGQRDLGAQPGALVAHRVLGDLHQDLLAVLERVADAAGALLALRRRDLVDVEKAVLLEAEVDERSVDAVHDVLDLALVDVAQVRLAIRALDVDLSESAVLDQRDAQLFAVIGDEDDLALRPLGDHGRAPLAELERRDGPEAAALVLPDDGLGAPAVARPGLRLGLAGRRSTGLGLRARPPRRSASAVGLRRVRRPRRPRPRPPRACRACAVRRGRRDGDASPRSLRARPPRILPGPRRARRPPQEAPLRVPGSRRPRRLRPPARRRPPRPRAPPLRARCRRSCAGGGHRGCRGGDAWRAPRRRRRRPRLLRRLSPPTPEPPRGRRWRSRRAAGSSRRQAGRGPRAVRPPRWRPCRPPRQAPPPWASGGCGCCGSSPPVRADRPSPRLRPSRRPAAPRRVPALLGAGRLLSGGCRAPAGRAHRDQRRGRQVGEGVRRGRVAVPRRRRPCLAGRLRRRLAGALGRRRSGDRLLVPAAPAVAAAAAWCGFSPAALSLIHVRGATLGVGRGRRLVAGRALLGCAHEVNSFRRRTSGPAANRPR